MSGTHGRAHAVSAGTIGIVVQNEYPHATEVRPRKLGRVLREHGYEVVYLAENGSASPSVEELGESMGVYRFPPPHWRGPARRLAKGHPWNLAWAAFIWRVARRRRLDLLISGNIGLGLQTALVGRALGIPVILDLFENNPAAVEARGKQRPIHHLTRSRTIVDMVERLCVRLSDRVWVVAHENEERLVRRGVSRSRIGLVGNTPDLDAIEAPARSEHRSGGPFRLVYVGVLHAFRGLDLVLEVVRRLADQSCDVELVVAGDGPDRDRLERGAARLGVSRNVRFLGWVAAERVAALIAECDVGVIANRVCEHTNTTLPNKLFDYMACGVPVASTPIEPVARIIREEGCGVVFSPDDPAEAAEALLAVLRDPGALRRMGENGRLAVEHRYNWSADARVALRDVKLLIERRAGSGTLVRPRLSGVRGGAG